MLVHRLSVRVRPVLTSGSVRTVHVRFVNRNPEYVRMAIDLPINAEGQKRGGLFGHP